MRNLKININLKTINKEIDQKLEADKASKIECSNILENIYISGYHPSSDYDFLMQNNFTHILNSAGSSRNFTPKFYDKIEYLVLDIKDEPGFNLIYSIYSAIDFIEKSIKSEGKILIHCFEGVSRAPALLASYLMWKYKYSREKAVSLIKEKRNCVDINLGFLFQLDKWQDFIKNNKENELYKIDLKGTISLIKKSNFDHNLSDIAVILSLSNNVFYKIIINSGEEILKNLNIFVKFLQVYDDYPEEIKTIDLWLHLNEDNFSDNKIVMLEEIIKLVV